jgi:CheY-like chemotaxis protein
MKVLLVDDNYVDMKEFCDELVLEGHQVHHAHDYEQLRDFCDKGETYDGIILDLMLPPDHGIDVTESMYGYRSGQLLYEGLIRHSYPDVPFVILTAVDKSTEVYQHVLEDMSKYNIFRGCFNKPVEVQELIDSLREQPSS